MWFFLAGRVLYAIPNLLGVSLVVFLMRKMVPGDAADIMIPPEAPKEVAEMIRARFGLDQPVHIQYLRWLQSMATGNFGTSIFTNQPVGSELFSALTNTFLIATPAVFVGFTCGVLLGTLAAFNSGTWLDKLFSSMAIAGVSLPHYWVGMVLVAIFAAVLNVLPGQGMGPEGFPGSWEQIKHLVLPVVTLSLIPMGVISRLVRANVLEILSMEFVTALAAKGLRRRNVLLHIMKNAAPSALALMGLQFGYLLGGSILVETVFNWPGSGSLLNLAIFRRDIPVLSATILVLATIFVAINILVDVLQTLIDPRIRR